jgi:Arc/MetJ-type ribon-helix-helix transcriptional regulator
MAEVTVSRGAAGNRDHASSRSEHTIAALVGHDGDADPDPLAAIAFILSTLPHGSEPTAWTWTVARSMVSGMATTKVTITLDDAQLASVRILVARGRAVSVSGFVKHAVSVALADVAGWGALLGAALEQTGGAPTAKERAWADSILKPAPRPRSRRRRKAA